MPAFELLLPLGALAFYGYDCAMLLYDNELLFLHGHKSWRIEAGSDQLLFRRRLSLPGLLQPWLAIYRLHWSDVPVTAGSVAADITTTTTTNTTATVSSGAVALANLWPLQLLCSSMLLLLLPILPLVSLGYGAGWAMLVVFALYYLLIFAALTLIWLRRRQWRLSGPDFASLALDSLACAPFAANLVRRVTLRQRYAADALVEARALCELPTRRELLATLSARLSERMAAIDLDNPQAVQLRARCQQLEGELV